MNASSVLVFDLDGTLAETADDLMRALNFLLVRKGFVALPLAKVRTMLGAGVRTLIQRGFTHVGCNLSDQELQRLFSNFLEYYNAHIADHSYLYPGVEATLDRLIKAGAHLAVCTNKMEHSARILLQALGIADRFAFICGQDTFGVAKPDPRPLLKTIAHLASAPTQAIMVGDTRIDIDMARAAGVPIIAVDFGYSDVPVTSLRPDRVISHFDELWTAAAGLIMN